MKKVIRRFVRNNNWSPLFYMIAIVFAYVAIASMCSLISHGFEYSTIAVTLLFAAAAFGCCVLAEIASYKYHRRLEMRRMRVERRRSSKLTEEEETARYNWMKEANSVSSELVLYRVTARNAEF